MAKDSSLGIVGHGIVSVNRDGSEQVETLREGSQFRANTMEGALLFRTRGAFLGASRMAIRGRLFTSIGKIPENIVIQADEYLFTMASVLAGVQILPEPLTYYRLHEANGFQLANLDPDRVRRKQQSLSHLSESLAEKLRSLGIDAAVNRALLQYTRASADQLRLMLDGGWPWETVKAESEIYEVVHPDARLPHRIFRLLTMAVALLTPPRFFYRAQRALAHNALYQWARQRWLPMPQMQHLQKDMHTKT